MKSYDIEVSWAEVKHYTVVLSIEADREDDATALAVTHVRSEDHKRRAINTKTIGKRHVEVPHPAQGPHIVKAVPVIDSPSPSMIVPSPGRRNHHAAPTEG